MAAIDFLRHENPPTWARVEPVTIESRPDHGDGLKHLDLHFTTPQLSRLSRFFTARPAKQGGPQHLQNIRSSPGESSPLLVESALVGEDGFVEWGPKSVQEAAKSYTCGVELSKIVKSIDQLLKSYGGAAETSRNIITRVKERDISVVLHKFLEESRAFQTRQHGPQYRPIGRELGRQKGCQLGSIANISLSSHRITPIA
ncbi:hypothetical protein TNCV_2827021 [Trichonephila clavipes]|nr:hypothetical protein TNCV_2827021 [Trichonephila clavipes]